MNSAGTIDDLALRQAREYADLGWTVIPLFVALPDGSCACGDQKCKKAGKHPAIRWGQITSPEQGFKSCEEAHRRLGQIGLAILTGDVSGGLIVVDVDVKDGKNGMQSLRDLEAQHGLLPETLQAKSGTGGPHYYFRAPTGTKVPNSESKIAQHIDIRGDGGYIVGPPTRHKCGAEYEWTNPADVAIAPEWLVKAALAPKTKKTAEKAVKSPPVSGTGGNRRLIGALKVVEKALVTENANESCRIAGFTCGGLFASGMVTKDEIEREFEQRLAVLVASHEKGNADDGREHFLRGFEAGVEQPFDEGVKLAHDRDREVTETIAKLSKAETIYQRGGNLIEVHEGESEVHPIERDALGTRMCSTTSFLKWAPKKEEHFPVQPPEYLIRAVHAERAYPGIRFLDGVTDIPILKPDGSVLDQPGYHGSTRLLYRPTLAFPPIPEPTDIDALLAARDLLDEMVEDFPFEKDTHKAAFMASLITLTVIHLIDGPCPLFLFDATAAGSGKGLLAQVLSHVALGRAPYIGVARNNNETRKFVLAAVMAAERLAVIDNLSRDQPLGCPTLDAALTATHWQDRILGESKMYSGPIKMLFVATGNNVRVHGDTGRRVVPIRLAPEEARPEERKKFRHPNLIKWITLRRGDIVAGILGLVRATILADEAVATDGFGSYEAWSAIVRATVINVWATDPIVGQKEYRDISDSDQETFERLLETWDRSLSAPHSPGDAINKVITSPFEFRDLREAIQAACPGRLNRAMDLPSAETLGHVLHSYRGRRSRIGWRRFEFEVGRGGRKLWHVDHSLGKREKGEVGEDG